MTTLRPYQQAAIDAIHAYWDQGGGNPLVDLATGTGKSIIIGELVRGILDKYPLLRVVMLVHTRELVSQNFMALKRVWQDAPVGIYSAGLGRRDAHHRITFASIQSVYRKARSLGRRDLILIDEAHLVPTAGTGMYRTLLRDLREETPDLRVAGFTATPFRLDSGRLDAGDDRLFDKTVFSYGIADGIADGYLSPLVSPAGLPEVDVSNVQRRGGEFVPGQLEDAADRIAAEAVQEIVTRGVDRRSWLVFCAGVRNAERTRDFVRRAGISCEMVSGETPLGERDRILRQFKNGQIRCLTNAQVLTTGFDAPQVDLVAMLRPTLSTSLYVQIVGRGTRIAPGKDNCIAEGQRVLTDHGLVAIEHVTTDMKVWDGVAFVHHAGIVFRGEQKVISYGGLTATPDHKVWSEEGWKAFGQCASEQAGIAITGDGRTPVRATEGRYRRGRSEGGRREASLAGRVPGLRNAIAEGLYQLDARVRRMPSMWQPTTGSEVACYAGNLSQAAMLKPKGQGLRTLWRAWHSLRVCIADGYGSLGSREPWASSGNGTRSYRERWSLRAGQSSLRHCEGAEEQYAQGGAKAKVYDILNAGPRHRFTVEGLLVSNCMILDFAGNVRRHGPVDSVSVMPKGSGKGNEEGKVSVDSVRAKECPGCHELVAINASTCKICGHEWPHEEKPKHEARAESQVGILSTEKVPPQTMPVVDWRFTRHEKLGSPDSVRVTYLAGLNSFFEWLAFEHGGYPQQKAAQWWVQHGGQTPFPKTTAEALNRANDGELTMPATISVKPRDKFFDIVGRSFPTVKRNTAQAELGSAA